MSRPWRVLVTGAAGLLGGAVLAALRDAGHDAIGLARAELDITDAAEVASAFERLHPEAVINCAAWTAVDLAEAHAAQARLVNAVGTGNLAAACRSTDAWLCQLSTDYVFGDDRVEPRDESAPPGPLNIYGHTKLEGEEAVRASGARGCVVRTAGLFAGARTGFVGAILRAAARAEPLRVVADQVTSPTFAGHLAPRLLRLMELDAQGTWHLSNAGATSWHAFAVAILAAAGVDVPVQPISAAEYGAPARRPRCSALDNRRWRELGEPGLPHWGEGLAEVLR